MEEIHQSSLEVLEDDEKRKAAIATAVEEFPKYSKLLWWWDHRLRKWANSMGYQHMGHTNNARFTDGCFIGSIYQVYYTSWYHYDQSIADLKQKDRHRGFRAYFGQAMHHFRRSVMRGWVKNESESWHRYIISLDSDVEFKHDTDVNYTYHEGEFHLYRVPERDDTWFNIFLDHFDTHEEAWVYLSKGLKDRESRILGRRIRHGHTLLEISYDEKVTKERIRQIESSALEKLQLRLKADGRFAEMWKD